MSARITEATASADAAAKPILLGREYFGTRRSSLAE